MIDHPRSANPLFLREEELYDGIELLLRAWHGFAARADDALAESGLGRAHHRALYFIGRHPDLTVGDLLSFLGITKQSLGRVLQALTEGGYLETRPGTADRRQKRLRLTESGRDLERRLSEPYRAAFAKAYRAAGAEAVDGFRTVLAGLMR